MTLGIKATADICVYDKSIREILHGEFKAHGIELDYPLVDFCTTVGLIMTAREDKLRKENERLRDVLSAIKDANEGNITPIVDVMYRYSLAPKNAETLEPDELGRAIIQAALGKEG